MMCFPIIVLTSRARPIADRCNSTSMVKSLTGFLYLSKHKILLVARRLGSYCGGFRSERRRFYYSGSLLMWDTWSRCLWHCIGRNQMVAGARTLLCTEARSLLLINELYDINWWIDEAEEIFLVAIFFNLLMRWSKQEMIMFFRQNWMAIRQLTVVTAMLQSPCFQIFRLSIIFMLYDTDTTAEERKLKD